MRIFKNSIFLGQMSFLGPHTAQAKIPRIKILCRYEYITIDPIFGSYHLWTTPKNKIQLTLMWYIHIGVSIPFENPTSPPNTYKVSLYPTIECSCKQFGLSPFALFSNSHLFSAEMKRKIILHYFCISFALFINSHLFFSWNETQNCYCDFYNR